MKKIKTFGLTNLRVEECFGYLKLVQTETANLPLQARLFQSLPPSSPAVDYEASVGKSQDPVA